MMNVQTSWRLDMFWHSFIILLANAYSGVAKECAGVLGGKLVAVEGTTIWKYDSDLTNPMMMINSSSPSSLDYDSNANILYWSDLNTREIRALKESSNESILVIPKQNDWLPFSIAVEPISKKLYVVDSYYNTIHLFDLLKENHAVVLGVNFTLVTDIVLDPYEGYLFVLDKYEIFRVDLDGLNRKIIYSRNNIENERKHSYGVPLNILNIALDLDGKRIFCADPILRRIESSDYNGEDRIVHFHNETEFRTFIKRSSLTFLNGSLYWVDVLDEKVIKIDTTQDNKIDTFDKNLLCLKGISCKKLEKVENPCERNNGGCQHLCVLSKSNKNNFKCACNFGYELSQDGRTCIPVHDFLLYTTSNSIRGLILNSSSQAFIDVINPTYYQVEGWAVLDFDARENTIYYVSLYPNDKIHQIHLDSKEKEELIPDILSETVGNFAYDWITKNLYYFTYYYADMTSLNVMNIRNATYSKILIENEKDLIRGIAVHPNKGYIYVSLIGANYDTINRMALDGSKFEHLIKLDSANILNTLALDVVKDRIYWSESYKSSDGEWKVQIRHSDLEGQDIRDLEVHMNLIRIDCMSIFNDIIYIIGGPDNLLIRLNNSEHIVSSTILNDGDEDTLSGLKIFSNSIQKIEPNNPCAPGHDCEKFCFPVPNAEGHLIRTCGCPYGEKLAIDGKSCVDNHVQEPPFVRCESTTDKCMKRTKSKGDSDA